MADSTVTPTWLADQLKKSNKDLRIFDTTITINGLGDEEFSRQHIPGAGFLNLFKHAKQTKQIPVNLPDVAEFQEYLQELGVSSSSHVILYENTDLHGFAAPRGWWLFRSYGFHKVSVLDGGLKRWKEQGYSTTDMSSKYTRGDVTLKVNKALIRSFDEVISGTGAQIVDCRPDNNYAGEDPEPSMFLQAFMPALGMKKDGLDLHTGHIPGSVNVPYSAMFQEGDGVTLKAKEQLLQLFQNQGVDFKRPVISSCYVGLTACIFALAASVCGFDDVSIYYGSWVEYGQKVPISKVETTRKVYEGKHV